MRLKHPFERSGRGLAVEETVEETFVKYYSKSTVPLSYKCIPQSHTSRISSLQTLKMLTKKLATPNPPFTVQWHLFYSKRRIELQKEVNEARNWATLLWAFVLAQAYSATSNQASNRALPTTARLESMEATYPHSSLVSSGKCVWNQLCWRASSAVIRRVGS